MFNLYYNLHAADIKVVFNVFSFYKNKKNSLCFPVYFLTTTEKFTPFYQWKLKNMRRIFFSISDTCFGLG